METKFKIVDHADDLSLAMAAGNGDKAARQQLAYKLYDRVRATVRYLSANHRDQDDWVQQALVEIMRSAGSFRGDSSLATWANKITVRKTLKLLKRQKHKDTVVRLESDPLLGCTKKTSDTERRFFMRKHLARAFEGLSPKYRAVLTLRIIHEFSIEEIADTLDAPVNTVRQRLRRGRKALAAKVSKDPVLKDMITSRKP